MTSTEAAPFTPTDRQEAFRFFARKARDLPPPKQAKGAPAHRPPLHTADFLDAQHNGLYAALLQGEPLLQAEAVTRSEWLTWERQEGFLAWWFDFFPELAQPSDADYQTLAGLTIRATVEGIARGEAWAVQSGARLVAERERAKRGQGGDLLAEVTLWLQSDPGSWGDAPPEK